MTLTFLNLSKDQPYLQTLNIMILLRNAFLYHKTLLKNTYESFQLLSTHGLVTFKTVVTALNTLLPQIICMYRLMPGSEAVLQGGQGKQLSGYPEPSEEPRR